MAKSINFNNITKRYLNVTFTDEKNTTVMVCMPTKGILRELTNIQAEVDTEDDFAALDELYNVCAKVLSRNKAGKVITPEFLEDVFDFDDIMIFLKEYMNFVAEAAGRKN